ncbi:unnamed protein product [Rhizoctonia solani]|uniref:NADP-dependent oxidoreductase domain-containing protein n=1 Tax=Rhizoctonia solani TaxID=456999 RepID=A0A8H3BZG6_9AGAM|nr:unnamed protein product [Rhizoctonia solani]
MSAQETQKKMTYVRLGNSGLKVSRIILGLMSYGSKQWSEWVLEEEEAIKHIKKAYDLGIQTFDTANVYSNGESERIFGKAIKQLNLPRDEIVVMTKLYATVGRNPGDKIMDRSQGEAQGYVNQSGLSRKHIFEAVKHSLERLQLDYVDVLQCHRLLYREEEREMVPTLKMFGVGMIPWSPLARGLLTRPVSQSETTNRSQTDPWAKYLNKTKDANDKIVSRVETIAKSKGVSMAQVAIAWSLSKDGMTAPIIGTTNLHNLEDIAGSIHVKLTEEEIKQLEEPYLPQAIVGHT